MSTADLHVHTRHSDGVDSPSKIVERAFMLGLSAIAITDHNTMLGVTEAKAAAKKFNRNVEVIPGCEVSTKQGHVIGIYISRTPKKGMSAQYTIDEIHEQGGLAIAAHPYVKKMGVQTGILRVPLTKFDAVEVINGSPASISANLKAVRHWMGNMSKYAAVGGSDAHVSFSLGTARTQYEGSLYEAIQNKMTGIRLSPRDMLLTK